MLKLKNVSKHFDTFHLEKISLELPGGYILGLTGENGAGKTTLLRVLAGLYRMDGGSVCLDGITCGGSDETAGEDPEAAMKQQTGAVFHGDLFEGRDTLLGNARRYGRFYRNYDESLLNGAMALFGLDGRCRYGRLSKGEKLKFAFAFALAHKPKLLLLDEPAANFDREFRQVFQDILRRYTENGENTVILSTHMVSDIDRLADYLLYLKEGRAVLYGDIESIRSAYRMAAGEAYQIRLLKDRVVHMEEGEFGAKALICSAGKPPDPALKLWEPSVEELMYYMAKAEQGLDRSYMSGHISK